MALQRPPLPATLLTAAGALPFVLAAVMGVTGRGISLGVAPVSFPADSGALAVGYGTVILSFMSGVLWGFAAQAAHLRALTLLLSVLPALYAYFMVSRADTGQQQALMIGFLGVLALDALYQWLGLTPRWWLTLRVPVTGVVFICLALA